MQSETPRIRIEVANVRADAPHDQQGTARRLDGADWCRDVVPAGEIFSIHWQTDSLAEDRNAKRQPIEEFPTLLNPRLMTSGLIHPVQDALVPARERLCSAHGIVAARRRQHGGQPGCFLFG